jgi:drug/metabolite transporter (DMT)-like permease
MTILNVILPMSLIFYGLTGITSGLGAILNATTPIFTVLVMHFMSDNEKITWSKAIGVLFGFIGVGVLIGFEGETKSLWFMLAGLAAALSYGFSALYGRRLAALKLQTLHIAFGQMACATLIMLGLNILWPTNAFVPPPETRIYLAVLTLGVLCTGVAYLLFFKILVQAGGTNIMLVTFLIPLSSLLLGVMFLNEAVLAQHLWGMGLIGLGLIAIDGRLFKRAQKLLHKPAP